MLFKQRFVGVQNDYIAVKWEGSLKLQGCSWQLLADIVLKMAGGVPEFAIAQKIQVLRDSGMCLKPHPQWPPSSILDVRIIVSPF